jgi:cytoskeletal protein RodZ
MDTSHFGTVLREARERQRLSLADVARKTKVPQASLERIEEGKLEALPAEVFVRGFIRSYARSVGVADAEPIGLYEQALAARRRIEEALAATPTALPVEGAAAAEEDGAPQRRGIGIAVFVIIVLLIATITLSLFLRQPPQSGERLSLNEAPGLLLGSDAWAPPS